jgi:hypothetical protein
MGAKGHWVDIRSTSLALLAINLVHEERSSPLADAALCWIRSRQRTETEGEGKLISWDTEVWDTALAIMALSSYGSSAGDPDINSALDWIGSLAQINDNKNIHFEPWETYYGIAAFVRSNNIEKCRLLYPSLQWYCSLETNGMVINPHYTAFLVILGKLVLPHLETRAADLCDLVRRKAEICRNRLIADLNNRLWTSETWANAYILYALTGHNKPRVFSPGQIHSIIQWFDRDRSPEGGFKDSEATALACLGLFQLLVSVRMILYERDTIQNPVQCRLAWERQESKAVSQLLETINRLTYQPDLPFFHVDEQGRWNIRISRTARIILAVGATIVGGVAAYLKFLTGIFGG